MAESWALDTLAIQAGEPHPRIQGAAVLPIFQSATFCYGTEGTDLGYDDVKYLRCNNTPSHGPLNAKLAALEGAEAAMVTASGMAAISTTLLTFLKSGDHLLAQKGLYGGTAGLLTKDFPDLNIQVSFIDLQDPSSWQAAVRSNTKVIYVEAITNPLLEVGCLPEAVAFARAHNLVSMIDATFASPVNYLPLQTGFDIVLHSATKYLNGHSDLCAGVLLGSKQHVRKVTSRLNHFGGCLDPHTCFLLHRGLKTLGVRVRQQNVNALAVAKFLEKQPQVKKVHYPGLPSHSGHQRATQLFKGYGGMVSFEVHGGVAAADQLLKAVRVPLPAVSLGGVESLITRPATSTHVGMTADERALVGVTDELIRVSVGIEDAQDLIADFGQALALLDAPSNANGIAKLEAGIAGIGI